MCAAAAFVQALWKEPEKRNFDLSKDRRVTGGFFLPLVVTLALNHKIVYHLCVLIYISSFLRMGIMNLMFVKECEGFSGFVKSNVLKQLPVA